MFRTIRRKILLFRIIVRSGISEGYLKGTSKLIADNDPTWKWVMGKTIKSLKREINLRSRLSKL